MNERGIERVVYHARTCQTRIVGFAKPVQIES
jgi:hypothetical protein